MELVESYNQIDLSKDVGTPVSRIKKDKDKYIPIKIITAQTRATDRGYSVRYVKVKDVEQYLRDNNKELKNKRDLLFKKNKK